MTNDDISNYEKCLEYIKSCYAVNTKKGFDDLRGILSILGNPHKSLKSKQIIHVAGTNGKGSFCAMMDSVLRAGGYSSAMFISPHLISFNERFRFNGQLISDDDLVRLTNTVKFAIAEYFGNSRQKLSFFQLLTIVAFCWFDEQSPDFILLETGLGGRLDATNVIERPLLSVIMSIGLDHTEILGNTLEEITAEKAGIIKENGKTVLYYQDTLVYNIVKKVCSDKSAALYCAKPDITVKKRTENGIIFDAKSHLFSYKNLELGLLGEIQTQNACAVLSAVAVLNGSGIRVSEFGVREGLKNARWEGRADMILNLPVPFMIDGAHNADGAAALAQTLIQRFGGKELTLVVGILNTKNYKEIFDVILSNVPNIKNIVCTTPNYAAKAVPAQTLANFAAKYDNVNIFCRPNFKDAVDTALAQTSSNGAVCAFGSLYLTGDLLDYLKPPKQAILDP